MRRLAFPIHTPQFRLLIASSLAVNLLALALPVMTMQIYDRIMTNHAVDTLLVLSTGVIVAAFMDMILRFNRNVLLNRIGATFEHKAEVQAVSRLIETEPRQWQDISEAALVQDVTSASRIKDFYNGQFASTLMVDMPFALLLLGFVFFLSPTLGAIIFTVVAIGGYFSWQQGIGLKRWMMEREKHDDHRFHFIAQAFQAIHTVKAFCLEAFVARRYEDVQHENGRINYNIASLQGAAVTLGYSAAQFTIIAIICFGAPMVVRGEISVGTLVACVMISGQIMQPLQRALGLWLRIQDIAIARKRLNSLLTLDGRDWHKTEELQSNHGAVQVQNLRFAYDSGAPVLDGISLELAPGEVVALTGVSGCGKTTLLELIAGIYRPDKGRVLVSGMDPWRMPAAERRRYIAYLPASGMILRGSIMDNLTGFDVRHQAEARHIAELLGIERSVALLPAGYDTMLEGLATDVISPGLKQRISMARTLLWKPRLILYDNADQGLDKESYGQVFDLLARLKGKATLLIVSEDRNILSIADKQLDLRRGHIVPVMEPAVYTLNRHRN